MSKWADLLSYLDEDGFRWLLTCGGDVKLPSGHMLVKEGTGIDAIYFILKGVFRVVTKASSDFVIARLGPGDVVGDLSFLDNHAASASIVAEENSEVYQIPSKTLMDKVRGDRFFAADFYRALSCIIAQRLRYITGFLGTVGATAGMQEYETLPFQKRMTEELAILRGYLLEKQRSFEEGELESGLDYVLELRDKLSRFVKIFANLFSGKDEINESFATEIVASVRRELMPLLLSSDAIRRVYSKPRGFVGDFVFINTICDEAVAGKGFFGELIDSAFLGVAPIRAMANARSLLSDYLRELLRSKGGSELRVASLGCGPAREIFDCLSSAGVDASSMRVTLIDFDSEALSSVEAMRDSCGSGAEIELLHENPACLALGKATLELPPQDLVYGLDLLGNCADKMAIELLSYIYGLLSDGGRLLLCSFHTSNHWEKFMQQIFRWELIHRSEEDIERLFRLSRFGRSPDRIFFEEEGVCLFSECQRE